MKRYLVRMVDTQLQFHLDDGWTGDLVTSLLEDGELYFNGEGYYHLAFRRLPASLNLARLKDLVSDVVTGEGRFLSFKERDVVLKYHSCIGLFKHGDDPSWAHLQPPGGWRDGRK